MWWRIWDHGGNWALFVVAFLLIEGTALYTGHRTLSAAWWAVTGRWSVVLALGLQALALILFAHLVGDWGR